MFLYNQCIPTSTVFVFLYQMMAEEFSHTVLHKNPAQVRAPLHPIRPQVDHVLSHQRPAAKNGTVECVFVNCLVYNALLKLFL